MWCTLDRTYGESWYKAVNFHDSPSSYTAWILNLDSTLTQESNTSNGSQFEVEIGEIWPIEAILRKKHVVMRLHTGPITFGCLGSFLGLFLGSFFW